MSKIEALLDFTPNPNSLKYSVNLELCSSAIFIKSKTQASEISPLAKTLFDVEGVTSVMIGRNFITISKTEESDWDEVHSNCNHLIETFLNSDQEVFSKPIEEIIVKNNSEQSEVEKKICEILDNEIRPAVALDGGDITFDRFEDGILYLELKGSCSGCPSSSDTLKLGIEQRLKSEIPELIEVVSI
jgi:Fe-S cluster biogenesis protein NfuA